MNFRAGIFALTRQRTSRIARMALAAPAQPVGGIEVHAVPNQRAVAAIFVLKNVDTERFPW